MVVVDDSADELILASFDENDVVGERSFLDGKPRASTGRMEGSGEVLMLSRDTLASLLDRHTEMAINLILGLGTLLARRLGMANRTLRLLPDEELGEKAEVSRLLGEMRKSLHIKPIR
jgi:CRP-like cAMP-binding protein